MGIYVSLLAIIRSFQTLARKSQVCHRAKFIQKVFQTNIICPTAPLFTLTSYKPFQRGSMMQV